MDYCLIRSSTHSNNDCRIGLSDFVSLVIEYSDIFPTPPITLRVTRPWASSSFSRREIVVEDESTNLFKSENRTGLFFLSMTMSMCNDFDFVNSSSKLSTPLYAGLQLLFMVIIMRLLYLFFGLHYCYQRVF